MKVLIVLGGYFPGRKFGGPPVSVNNFCSLMKDYQCYIVTLNHDLFEKESYSNIEEGWNDRSNCKVLYLNDSEYNRTSFERIVDEICPDIIYLQGIFQRCIIPCLQIAKKQGIKVLLAPRGELCYGAFSKKRYKKIPYLFFLRMTGLIKHVHFQSTSEEETQSIIKLLHIIPQRIHFLDNIPSLPAKEYSKREKHAGEGRFVFLSRIHPKKNLISAIRFFSNVKGQVLFDIYGPIEDNEYWQQCSNEIELLPDNVKVSYKGLVEHDSVHEIFSKYDAFIFPTLSENYGHVIAESLVVGTPVIISDRTPWTNLNNFGCGGAYPLNDFESFRRKIQNIVDADQSVMCDYIDKTYNYIESKFRLDDLKNHYESVFNLLVGVNSGD